MELSLLQAILGFVASGLQFGASLIVLALVLRQNKKGTDDTNDGDRLL